MIRLCRILPILAVALSNLHAQTPLLYLDFNNSSAPAMQRNPLPEMAVHGDYGIPSGSPGFGDFGANGYLLDPQFETPSGPFTVEAGFRLREYGSDTATFSTVLVNATEGGQGFALQIGGGPNYPILPGTNLVHPSIWAASEESTSRNRSLVSSCVGTFSMPTPDGQVLEAYTRVCLQLGEWIHLTATWDGNAMHLYVNGQEETDSLRILGRGLQPRYPVQIPIYVGVQDSSGARHLNGQVDFVRVLDGVLTGAEILQRFQESSRPEDRSYDCQGAITAQPTVVQGACDLSYSKLTLSDNDSLEVQYSKDWDFTTIGTTYRIPVKFFKYNDHYNRATVNDGRAFWRAHIVRAPAPTPPVPENPPPPVPTPENPTPPVPTPENPTPPVPTPENPTPPVPTPENPTPPVPNPEVPTPEVPTHIQIRTVAWNGSDAIRVPEMAGADAPQLYRVDGTRISFAAERIGGAWELRPQAAEPGLVLVRTKRSSTVKP